MLICVAVCAPHWYPGTRRSAQGDGQSRATDLQGLGSAVETRSVFGQWRVCVYGWHSPGTQQAGRSRQSLLVRASIFLLYAVWWWTYCAGCTNIQNWQTQMLLKLSVMGPTSWGSFSCSHVFSPYPNVAHPPRYRSRMCSINLVSIAGKPSFPIYGPESIMAPKTVDGASAIQVTSRHSPRSWSPITILEIRHASNPRGPLTCGQRSRHKKTCVGAWTALWLIKSPDTHAIWRKRSMCLNGNYVVKFTQFERIRKPNCHPYHMVASPTPTDALLQNHIVGAWLSGKRHCRLFRRMQACSYWIACVIFLSEEIPFKWLS